MKKVLFLNLIFIMVFSFIYSEISADLMFRAKSGDSEAQTELGLRYYYGSGGIEIDLNKAFSWFKKAANNNNPAAIYQLGTMYESGFRNTKNPDYQKAFDYYKKSADMGYSEAQYELGSKYEFGFEDVVDEDYKQALAWYEKAAEGGFSEAQYELGYSYFEGTLTRKDNNQAFKWLTRASENNHAEAQYYLGTMYCNGLGCEKNHEKAKYWLKKAYYNAEDDVTLQDMVKIVWNENNYGDL